MTKIKHKTEYWVHYNFINGYCMNIKTFTDKNEAERFAAEQPDAIICEWEPIEYR